MPPETDPDTLPAVAELRGALVAGPRADSDANARLWRGQGLYDADGAVAAEAADRMAGAGRLERARLEQAEWLEQALFCGRYRRHFGHLVAEGLGRLWAAERAPSDLPLLWFAHPAEAAGERRLLGKALDLIGLANPVVVATGVVRVGRLMVPPALSDPLFGVAAAPAFQDWLTARLPPADGKGRDLYVSRTRLGDDAGRFLGEAALEEGLAAAGYEIVHPQALSLARQVALYRGARRIVAAEGSALHLLALLDVPGLEVAVVMRRPRLVASLPATFASFRRGRVRVIDQVRRCWSLTANPHALFRAVSEIDLPAVWEELAAAGFIGPGPRPAPDAGALEAERLRRAADRRALLT